MRGWRVAAAAGAARFESVGGWFCAEEAVRERCSQVCGFRFRKGWEAADEVDQGVDVEEACEGGV